ncbi:isochorismatase family protein [Amycolatopsis jiangsuensis]|uniref:Ureidoacrylate peracid hydrolase n=1 Tax=Amycolatopsis jiangsuensis TaxID=1181879 RepID=A0A840IPT3_9PSEU|nr:isochorismatase family cysteine hydrolase [Amycolatopsis jiangsuensis]MBB4683873.1 ureidoacrylate peracid hydrolase [Amycolatopsis jiangsuensis]
MTKHVLAGTDQELPFHPERAALLVIDMTNDFLAEGAPYECAGGRALLPRINRLIGLVRGRGLPVVCTTQVHHRDGADLGMVRYLHPLTGSGKALVEGTGGVALYPDLDFDPATGEFLVKRRYSAFYGTDLENFLRRRGIDSVIVTGVATHSCCEATARDALFRDFAVYFVSDATATVGLSDAGWGAFTAEEVQRFALTDVAHFLGRVGTTGELATLLGAAR